MFLTQLDEELWICPVPYRAMGMWIGRQLVVVRLPGGGLWIHSPIPWTVQLRDAIEELGEVQHVVGPNHYHDECLREFQLEYPDAQFHGAPGLSNARRDIHFHRTLGPQPDAAWAPVLDQHLVAGMPKLNEVVFFHRASRSLIVADLVMNLVDPKPWATTVLLKMAGVWGRFGPTRFCRMLMHDREAVRASLERILAWDFDRIIVGHGRNIETGGRAAMREAFRFLVNSHAR